MRKFLLLFSIMSLAAVPVSAQEYTRRLNNLLADAHDQDNESLRVGHQGVFGETAVYNLTNVISLQSTFGTSARWDRETTTGTGSIGLDEGYIQIKTGTTTGSTARVDTEERGQYQPGKGAEFGVAIIPVTPPDSGTEKIEWGLGDGDNGIFWRYYDSDSDGSFELCTVYETNQSETEVCEGSFNKRSLGDFDPSTTGAIYVVRFNWYGVGGADYWIYSPSTDGQAGLESRLIHRHSPSSGQALEDPNLPIFAEADNGDGTTDVELKLGGRRYDIQGEFEPPLRSVGDYRFEQSITASGNPITPTVCLQRESAFPVAGRQNSVNVFVERFDVASDQDLIAYFVSGASVTSGSFGTPTNYSDAETATDSDTSGTAISGGEFIGGPYLVDGGSQGQDFQVETGKGRRIDVINTDTLCLVVFVPGASDATVTTALRWKEEW